MSTDYSKQLPEEFDRVTGQVLAWAVTSDDAYDAVRCIQRRCFIPASNFASTFFAGKPDWQSLNERQRMRLMLDYLEGEAQAWSAGCTDDTTSLAQ